jgi:hypothetical protein
MKEYGEKIRYEIFDTLRDTPVTGGDVDGDTIELLIPDIENLALSVNGKKILFNPVLLCDDGNSDNNDSR